MDAVQLSPSGVNAPSTVFPWALVRETLSRVPSLTLIVTGAAGFTCLAPLAGEATTVAGFTTGSTAAASLRSPDDPSDSIAALAACGATAANVPLSAAMRQTTTIQATLRNLLRFVGPASMCSVQVPSIQVPGAAAVLLGVEEPRSVHLLESVRLLAVGIKAHSFFLQNSRPPIKLTPHSRILRGAA
ncbi:hypothetical protein AHiyo1_13370 [Arthrobacter sp. Hiyo1]|nr:hypothetical protein AHiyo1_13370 [Arthrobacter sp. Hiyo1]